MELFNLHDTKFPTASQDSYGNNVVLVRQVLVFTYSIIRTVYTGNSIWC